MRNLSMKKYFSIFLAVLGMMAFTACSTEEGTNPGNDSKPMVTLYQYVPAAQYNSDEDVLVRFAANSVAKEFYYMVEKLSDKEAFVASNGAEAYTKKVVDNGTKVTVGETDFETTLTGMAGQYAITAAAVAADGSMTASETVFNGLAWKDVVAGTYYFAYLGTLGLQPTRTVLQICESDDTLYRFKDVFGNGKSLKFQTLPDYIGKDAYGTYMYFRIPEQMTGLSVSPYGEVGVRDVGYWQGDSAYVTDHGYESGIYIEGDVNYCFVYASYYVSAGTLGYDYDEFIPDTL